MPSTALVVYRGPGHPRAVTLNHDVYTLIFEQLFNMLQPSCKDDNMSSDDWNRLLRIRYTSRAVNEVITPILFNNLKVPWWNIGVIYQHEDQPSYFLDLATTVKANVRKLTIEDADHEHMPYVARFISECRFLQDIKLTIPYNLDKYDPSDLSFLDDITHAFGQLSVGATYITFHLEDYYCCFNSAHSISRHGDDNWRFRNHRFETVDGLYRPTLTSRVLNPKLEDIEFESCERSIPPNSNLKDPAGLSLLGTIVSIKRLTLDGDLMGNMYEKYILNEYWNLTELMELTLWQETIIHFCHLVDLKKLVKIEAFSVLGGTMENGTEIRKCLEQLFHQITQQGGLKSLTIGWQTNITFTYEDLFHLGRELIELTLYYSSFPELGEAEPACTYKELRKIGDYCPFLKVLIVQVLFGGDQTAADYITLLTGSSFRSLENLALKIPAKAGCLGDGGKDPFSAVDGDLHYKGAHTILENLMARKTGCKFSEVWIDIHYEHRPHSAWKLSNQFFGQDGDQLCVRSWRALRNPITGKVSIKGDGPIDCAGYWTDWFQSEY